MLRSKKIQLLHYPILLWAILLSTPLFGQGIKLKVTAAESAIAAQGTSCPVKVAVVNESDETIHAISYTVITNKVRSEETSVDLDGDGLGARQTGVITLPIAADEETGSLTKRLTITKVNGAANLSTENTADFTFMTVTRLEDRKAVMEEYTGLWCGFCPRGEAALNRLEDEYGGRVIGISIHGDDVLECSDYRSAQLIPNSFPKSSLNREIKGIDPYIGSEEIYYKICPVRNDLDRIISRPVEAAIELSPEWTDESRQKISTHTRVTFRLNSSKARYAIAYVLLADSVIGGSGKSGAQSNYYYHNDNWRSLLANDPYMDEYFDSENIVKYGDDYYLPSYPCMRVALAAYGIAHGVNNSLPQTIHADEEITHDYEISIGNISNAHRRLRVAALLLNYNTGVIVNAAMAEVGTDSTTPAQPTTMHATSGGTEIYTTHGMKINTLRRGLNIIRTSDGKWKKVLKTRK